MTHDLIYNVEKPLNINSAIRNENGVLGPEKEEVIDEPLRGVELKQASCFAVLEGNDGLVIEAALTSGGELIDLEELISQS
ncbi:hypothetical protein BD769DRAFT_1665128 [Suillus cothurnatus]|nr:hypothetical protein BD769DRAFT_1665128 [Suillus cothurnatus]